MNGNYLGKVRQQKVFVKSISQCIESIWEKLDNRKYFGKSISRLNRKYLSETKCDCTLWHFKQDKKISVPMES